MMSESTSPPSRALIVEDDEHVAVLLKFIIEREGFVVTLARDGREAERFIEELVPPDLVMLDVMLPYLDGFQLISKIRDKPEWKDAAVMMLTAKAQEGDIVRALDAGANGYVVKPFQPNELKARIRGLMRKKSP